ncbi:uncharacterized protein BJ212DRAFT_1480762 [Suillus subaureus]|uniref:Uncharacterized protein n=1 Tax=Suillus subaureus TaxID=48587 RepID=A0A9P7JDN2_9AGAM|nr:uncharacterized protein BJ212DRAFT_1480762 [Suillus subaureus]KAG1816313.1 hypothetical protein BJ212DRAFT_1480762 [Suillus subaureus]
MGIKRAQCDDDDDNDDNELVSFEEIAAAHRKAKDPGNAACSTAVMKLPAAEDLSYHSPHHSMQPLEHSSDADNDSVLLEQSLTDFPMGEEFPAHSDIDVIDFMNDSVEEQRADADHNNKMSHSLPPQKPDPLTGTESSDKQPKVPPSSVQVPDMQPALPVPVNELLEPSLSPDVILDGASQHWFWKIILILVVWLNLCYHLPHCAANLLLKVTVSIFYGLGVFTLEEKPAQMLNTAFALLALADYFEVHPMCPTCMRVFPHNSPSDTVCTHCSTPLCHETRPQDIPTATKPSRLTMKPKLRCPQNPLSNDILQLLSQDGIELQLDAWRSQLTTPGKHSSIQDGPKELDSDQLQFFMKDYVDDLLQLYDKGIIIKTSKYPEGRHVYVILVAVCCNHPVMCKSKLKTEDAMEYDSIIKTQWFNAWVQTNVLRQKTAKVEHELDEIHRLLSMFEMPSWILLVWEKWYPINMKQNQKEIESWEKWEQVRIRRVASGKQAQNRKDNEPPTHLKDMAMHADDADNFLNLAAALKIILGWSISDTDIPQAKELLNKYLLRFLEIHPKHVKPSHHWVTHIFEQLEDYGPIYGFWMFLFECLNKVLKSYSTNNHGDGKIEISFFRAFTRDTKL